MRRSKILIQRIISKDGRTIAEARSEARSEVSSPNDTAHTEQSVTVKISSSSSSSRSSSSSSSE
jgi:hypothetical protein